MFQIKNAILNIVISIISLILADYFFEGVYFENYWVIIITSLMLSVLNTFVKPILLFHHTRHPHDARIIPTCHQRFYFDAR